MSNVNTSRLVCLVIAFTLAAVWWVNTSDVETPDCIQTELAELDSLCEGDSLLAQRLNARLFPAIKIGRAHGRLGLETLDIFGDDAVFLFEKNPEAFSELKKISELEGSLFSASSGEWKQPVVQWATAGTLSRYLEKLNSLTDEETEILGIVPEALPLLIADNTPTANKMLQRFDHRGWQLFQAVDLRDSDSIERVATALELHGEPMLDLNERFGPAIAWMLIPAVQDVDGVLPTLFLDAISDLGDECASALFLTNYDDILALIYDGNCNPGDIRSAIAFIASQSRQELREWVADSPYSIRLILEDCDNQRIGQQIFARCGPAAATLLYQPGGLGVEPIGANDDMRRRMACERLAVLMVLRDEGWNGMNFLWEYQNIQSLRQLLQRKELVENTDDPLISRVIRKLSNSSDVLGQLDLVQKKPAAQLLEEEYPESPAENWIPGYTALKYSGAWMKGYHVSKIDATFAVVDGVGTAFGVGAIVSQAVKTTGTQVVKRSIAKAGRELTEELAQNTIETSGKRLVSRIPGTVVASLRTLAENSGAFEVTQLARTATATAKRVGIRSWGTLDRRIIMRGDRKVIVDLLHKEVRDEAGKQIVEEIGWNTLFEVGPLLLERTISGLEIAN